jgi:hypothetical protein
MRPEAKLILLGLLAISAALPFVTIGVLAVMARFWKINPHVTLPWLRALRWVTWLIGLLLVAAVFKDPQILAYPHLSFSPSIGMSMLTASAGLGLSEDWVRRNTPASLPAA